MEEKKEFGRIRSMLFPIHGRELKKFIPLTLLFFMISFNYSMLRALKDIFVLTKTGGSRGLSVAKIIGVTPIAVFLTIIYNSLSSKLGRHKMFYLVLSYFFVFFTLFVFILLPRADALYLASFETFMSRIAPSFSHVWITMANWPFLMFYIHSELWGTFAISVALWTFINEITSVKQSKRFYSFLALGANIALIFSGSLLLYLNNSRSRQSFIYIILALIVLAGFIYRNLYSNIQENPEEYDIEVKAKKKKAKLSMWESTKFLARSRYLRLIAFLVLSYGFVISLVEAVWKDKVQLLDKAMDAGGTITQYVYGVETIIIGSVAIASILFFAGAARKRGWRFMALVTPILATILGSIFFSLLLFTGLMDLFTNFIGVSSLIVAVTVGMLQVVAIKAIKYTMFDPTKEMAYIPLDQESKIRGKAAVDGVGGRLGKSLGSAILVFVLLPRFHRPSNVVGIIAVMVGAALFIWIYSVFSLSVEFNKATQAKKEQ